MTWELDRADDAVETLLQAVGDTLCDGHRTLRGGQEVIAVAIYRTRVMMGGERVALGQVPKSGLNKPKGEESKHER